MRRSLSIVILICGLVIGACASEGYSILRVEASPACPTINFELSDPGIALVPVTFVYAWDIPACATVHPVVFDVQQGVHAAYLAEMIKPPSVYFMSRQATSKNYDQSLMQSFTLGKGKGFMTSVDHSSLCSVANRKPRDGL